MLTHAAAVVETLLINLFIGKLNNCFHLLVSKISYERATARREPNQISNRNTRTHTATAPSSAAAAAATITTTSTIESIDRALARYLFETVSDGNDMK